VIHECKITKKLTLHSSHLTVTTENRNAIITATHHSQLG